MRSIVIPLLLLTTQAFAADGVLEINQTCAVQTGCFAGDTPGFPVWINSPGSYQLTGPLTVAAAVRGIEVNVAGVSLDLNGFSITGPGGCTGAGATISCAPVGGGTGVLSVYPTEVYNGLVTKFTRDGVFLGAGSRAVDLTLTENSDRGIVTFGETLIQGCIVARNGSDGIFAQQGSAVTANLVTGNAEFGISASRGSSVERNSVYANGSTGIVANGTDGATRISENAVSDNGSSGIFAQGGALVRFNAIRANGNFGLPDSPGVASGNNNIRGNAFLFTLQGGSIDPNVCDGSLVCP